MDCLTPHQAPSIICLSSLHHLSLHSHSLCQCLLCPRPRIWNDFSDRFEILTSCVEHPPVAGDARAWRLSGNTTPKSKSRMDECPAQVEVAAGLSVKRSVTPCCIHVHTGPHQPDRRNRDRERAVTDRILALSSIQAACSCHPDRQPPGQVGGYRALGRRHSNHQVPWDSR